MMLLRLHQISFVEVKKRLFLQRNFTVKVWLLTLHIHFLLQFSGIHRDYQNINHITSETVTIAINKAFSLT